VPCTLLLLLHLLLCCIQRCLTRCMLFCQLLLGCNLDLTCDEMLLLLLQLSGDL
jgi:hypothetical protein